MVLIDGKPEYSCSRDDRDGRRQVDHDDRGSCRQRRAASVAAGVARRAGRPVRLLPVRHSDLGRGAACEKSKAQPRRHHRGARSAPLPLRHPQPRHPRGAKGRRGHGGSAPVISNTLPQSLIDNPILSQWIAFEEKGRVRVGSGKVEIGQGILTALTQIAAEELDVRPEQINLVSGADRHQPGRGLHLGQLFGRGRRRLDPSGLRRGALAVPRPRGGSTRAVRWANFRSRTANSCAPAQDTGRDYWSMAGDVGLERRASGTAPVKRPSTYKIVGKHLPRLDLPAKIAGAGFIHDIAPENVLHARVLRQPWRGARLAALDENAVRKAAKAPIEILREGEFVAFTSGSETRGDARRRSRAHARALGGRHAAARRRRHAGLAQGAALARQDHRHRPARPRAGANGRVRRGLLFAALPHLWLDRHVLRARRIQGRRAQGVVALAGPGGAARMARPRARPAAAQVTVFHRQGAGAYGHNTADDAAFDASFIAMRHPGRTVRVQWSREDEFAARPDQHRDGDQAPRRARCRQQAGRLDDRNLEPAARPASRHERQLQSARRRGAAQSAAAQPAGRRAGRARRRRDPQRRSRSTTCRATG